MLTASEVQTRFGVEPFQIYDTLFITNFSLFLRGAAKKIFHIPGVKVRVKDQDNNLRKRKKNKYNGIESFIRFLRYTSIP